MRPKYHWLLLAYTVLACNEAKPVEVPTYDRSTLQINQESGVMLALTLRCCGGQEWSRLVISGDHVCLVMNLVEELEMSAIAIGGTVHYQDTLKGVNTSPAWIWDLLPASATVRPDPTPCG